MSIRCETRILRSVLYITGHVDYKQLVSGHIKIRLTNRSKDDLISRRDISDKFFAKNGQYSQIIM
jgi:hypothetical protein